MTFFFDNNIGQFMVLGLRGFGEDVYHLTDHFPPDTRDEVWLRFVGDQRMALVTRDKRIRRRPLEVDAIKRHNVGAFILVGKQMGKWAQIEQVIHAWQKMTEAASSTPTPFAFRVNRSGGKLERLPLP